MADLTLDEARAAMLKAIELGNIRVANEEALARIALTNPDFTLVSVEMTEGNLRNNDGRYVNFEWETVSAGFGNTLFAMYNDGRVEIDNECMGRKFIATVLEKCDDEVVREKLMKLLPNAKLYHEPPPPEQSWQTE
jgi:hypothetical protein